MNGPQGQMTWPDQVKGTTLKARTFQVTVNGAAPANSLSAVSMVLAKDGANTITPTCTITSAANWQFTVGPVAAATMAVEEGIHEGDIKTTDSAGVVEKYVRVTMKILPSPQ
jgi:hypothetical protein